MSSIFEKKGLLGLLVLSALGGAAQARVPDLPAGSSWVNGKHYDASDIWLNSRPLVWDELRSNVILLVFWDYTDLDSLRTLDYVRRWDANYRRAGLQIIAIHSPQFDFAGDPVHLKEAVVRLGLQCPVINDAERHLSKAFQSTIPGLILMSGDRHILQTHTGQGNYAGMEQHIRAALRKVNLRVEFPLEEAIPPDPDIQNWHCGEMTLDVNLGSARGSGMQSYADLRETEGIPFANGHWEEEEDAERVTAPMGSNPFMGLKYRGAEVNGVLNSSGETPLRVYVEQDGHSLDRAHAGVDIRFDGEGRSYLDVREGRLYYLAQNPDNRYHDIRLFPTQTGLEIYEFSFSNRCLTHYNHL